MIRVFARIELTDARSEENNFYLAYEALTSDRSLPSSGLLEAIHAYSANFYDNAMWDWVQDDYQSMDETALIAMGILLEGMAQESLGETGDLILVEEEEIR
ncbi:hypothetical protein DTO271D3_1382 [Paecilomyces variotii]|nr:hypothetical protein DTO169E5_517 [Paecilomyces variotii]KAJ9318125.1 hypothetical protein DTO271D3_1382 [Paecilomyces variotii]